MLLITHVRNAVSCVDDYNDSVMSVTATADGNTKLTPVHRAVYRLWQYAPSCMSTAMRQSMPDHRKQQQWKRESLRTY